MQELNPQKAEYGPLNEAGRSAHQGNPGAFELIYLAYGALVRRICLRMLRDPIEAEDAMQDVFVRVLLKIDTFRGESAFSSWLFRLTTNLVLMRFRKNNHEKVSLAGLLDDDSGGPHVDIGGPDLNLTGLLDRIDLQAAINLLPAGYRAVFVLHDIQGYDHKEIADTFGYSIGNSKSRLHKARKSLRKLLGNMRTGTPAGKGKGASSIYNCRPL